MNTPVQAFTNRYDVLPNVLKTEVMVGPHYNVESERPKDPKKYVAIWDTGATNTAVSARVAAEAGLKEIDKKPCNIPSGKIIVCPIYFISLFLPNKVVIPQLRVFEADPSGADLLIGMDVITQGDFWITNFEGKTRFNFRTPSICTIDFATNPTCGASTILSEKPSRNAKCPCGSGEKYKKCCGKNANTILT
jgi:hypothetical protein